MKSKDNWTLTSGCWRKRSINKKLRRKIDFEEAEEGEASRDNRAEHHLNFSRIALHPQHQVLAWTIYQPFLVDSQTTEQLRDASTASIAIIAMNSPMTRVVASAWFIFFSWRHRSWASVICILTIPFSVTELPCFQDLMSASHWTSVLFIPRVQQF